MLQVEAGCIARPQAPTFEFAINDTGQHALPVTARVRVRNPRNGDVVLDVPSAGTVMLARLEPGSYEVDVTLGELTLTQPINVEIGQPAHAVFLWPSKFDMAAVVPRGSGETTALLSTRE
jgi:arylamine N-acetyltransferase